MRPRHMPAAILLASTLLVAGSRAATITIVNTDGAGEGFNDPTAVAPVGNNPGTTVGQQRLYVFQFAANIWGGLLPSTVEIRVNAAFNPLTCTATTGVLGSAGPVQIFSDFPGANFAATWYNVALANKLAGADLSASADINATFNSSVGGGSCLPAGWYYGVDGNEGAQIELLPVVLHELGHGLGFLTVTNALTGAQSSGLPALFDRFLFDTSTGLHWNQMSDAQRANSSVNCQKLSWDGSSAISHAPQYLGYRPELHVTSPPPVAGDYNVGLASFGSAITTTGVSGQVVAVKDNFGNPNNGCETDTNNLVGRIALIDRGTCTFPVKVKNAQNAGAIAAIIADSISGCPPAGLGGTDPTITIPSVRITQSDATLLKAQLGAGLQVTLRLNSAARAGTDVAGRPLMYTPVPYSSGSSVSHFDVSAEPSLLMEPSITGGLSSNVDLTRWVFQDLGWYQGVTGVADEPRIAAARHQILGTSPSPTRGRASVSFVLSQDDWVELGIYNFVGQRVRGVSAGRMTQGRHSLAWDGRDESGRPVPSGMYFARLRGSLGADSRTLVVAR